MNRYGEEVYLPGDGMALVVVEGPATFRPDGFMERELRTIAAPARDIFGAAPKANRQQPLERLSEPGVRAVPGGQDAVAVSECGERKNEPSGTNSNHSDSVATHIEALWRDGKSMREIAKLVGCSKTTVSRRLAGQRYLL